LHVFIIFFILVEFQKKIKNQLLYYHEILEFQAFVIKIVYKK